MGWWSDARTGAAHEFGRRHYRGFATFEIGRKALPLLAGAAAVAVVLGGLRWAAAHWPDTGDVQVDVPTVGGQLPALGLMLAGGLAVFAVLAGLLAKAIGWRLELYLPVDRAGLWLWVVLMSLGTATAGWIWVQAG